MKKTKKSLEVAGLGFLALACFVGLSSAQSQALPKRASFSLGGLMAMSGPGFTYTYVEVNPYYPDESLTFTDRQGRGGLLGWSLGAGYFISKKAEAFVGLSYARSGRQEGRVGLDIISPYIGSTHATAFQDRGASRFDLNAGVKFHISPQAGLDPYFGFGGCYSSAAVQLFKSATFGDYLDSISDVRLEDASTHALGGFALGGIEVGLGPGVSVYAESVFKIAQKAVRHPFSEALQRPQSIPVNMGGLTGSIGLKIRL